MILDIEEKIKFGMYKGKKIEEIILIDCEYITWLIGNVTDLMVSPFFLEKAIKINPFFSIPEKYLSALHHRIQNYVSVFENVSEDFMKSKEYLKYLNLSKEEREQYIEIHNKKTKDIADIYLNEFFKKSMTAEKKNNIPQN